MTEIQSTRCEIERMTPSAQIPTRGSALAAGLDVHADFLDAEGKPRVLKTNTQPLTVSTENIDGQTEAFILLTPGMRVLIPTGIKMRTSADVYTRIAPRSGLALKHGVDVLAGVVDADYAGEVGIVLLATDPHTTLRIRHRDRVAQLILERIALVNPVEVASIDPSDRGAGGFGSTGLG